MAVYQKPKTSQPHPQHKAYPYLLRGKAITRPNQVWCAEITYIPMRRGFLYLVAIMDCGIAERCSPGACRTPWMLISVWPPWIATAYQNSSIRTGFSFTSYEFTKTLREAGARISMDGRGRWMDNVMIERLWRSLKYECLYLREIETGSELCRIPAWWFGFYNNRRPHKTFDGRKAMEIYQQYKPEGVPPLISPRWAA